MQFLGKRKGFLKADCKYQALEDLSLQYDSSVRNSENTVVQFIYGDDNLNPALMENNDRPVDFNRLRLHVSQVSPGNDERLRPDDLKAAVEKVLSSEVYQALLPTGRIFHREIRDYFKDMAERQEALQATGNFSDDDIDRLTWNSCRFTQTQLVTFFEMALSKFTKAFVEPGEAVGAMGAQSISEPGTQMTLKVRLPVVFVFYSEKWH